MSRLFSVCQVIIIGPQRDRAALTVNRPSPADQLHQGDKIAAVPRARVTITLVLEEWSYEALPRCVA